MKGRNFYFDSFKHYEQNTNGIWSSFCQFYIAQHIFQIIITDVFDNDESIDNAFFLL
jgi:hypothetical protein